MAPPLAPARRITHNGDAMMKPSDNPADPFKKALAEATKVMADDPELSVSYSVDPPGATTDTMRLPQVSRRMTREEVLLARGTADAFALRHKFHDAGIANRCKVNLRKVSAEQVAEEGAEKLLAGVDGILVPGGFGERGPYQPRSGGRKQKRASSHVSILTLFF